MLQSLNGIDFLGDWTIGYYQPFAHFKGLFVTTKAFLLSSAVAQQRVYKLNKQMNKCTNKGELKNSME